jgi:hypothetical protein
MTRLEALRALVEPRPVPLSLWRRLRLLWGLA